jgi:hypothetical protein
MVFTNNMTGAILINEIVIYIRARQGHSQRENQVSGSRRSRVVQRNRFFFDIVMHKLPGSFREDHQDVVAPLEVFYVLFTLLLSL